MYMAISSCFICDTAFIWGFSKLRYFLKSLCCHLGLSLMTLFFLYGNLLNFLYFSDYIPSTVMCTFPSQSMFCIYFLLPELVCCLFKCGVHCCALTFLIRVSFACIFVSMLEQVLFTYNNYALNMAVVWLQHAYRDGRLEEVALRHLGNEDGQTVIATNIRFALCLLIIFFDHLIFFSY